MKGIIIEPSNPTPMGLIWKTTIGLFVGLAIAFFIFIMVMVFGGIFDATIRAAVAGEGTTNPILALIVMIIAFIAAFLWNIMVWITYNLFFNNKYYSLWKILSLISIMNIFLFFIVAFLYIIFNSDATVLFLILAFHIFFAVFISYTIIEIFSNPNYSGVHIIWTTIWLSFAILIFLIFYKSINIGVWWDSIELLLVLPPILSYTLIALLHWLWEKLYYKFYEMWNNFLYIPTIEEVLVNEEDVDEINVEEN